MVKGSLALKVHAGIAERSHLNYRKVVERHWGYDGGAEVWTYHAEGWVRDRTC